eukprot:3557927-Amphidinium_carterae.1
MDLLLVLNARASCKCIVCRWSLHIVKYLEDTRRGKGAQRETAMYTWQSVVLAAGLTSIVFVGLTIYAWCSTTDFTGMGPYLFAIGLVLCVFGFTICILQLCGFNVDWLIMAYDAIGVLLFSCYIVFDTQLMLGEYGGHKFQFSVDDYCMAALQLYLDIINLFLLLLELFGKRR